MRGLCILAVILAVLGNADAAHGHASLIGSEPPDRTVVAQVPATLTLTFNEPVSPLVLRLVQPNGDVADLKDVTANGPAVTIVMPSGLQRGTHLLSWRVVSADGHPVGGALTFSVGERSEAPTQSLTARIRLVFATWLARLVLYVGLFAGVGSVFYFHWIAAEPPPKEIGTAVNVAMQCGLAAAFVSVGLQGVDALGVPFSKLRVTSVWASGLATSYGLSLVVVVAALTLGLASGALTGLAARWCAALALVAVGLALATSGHASTAGPAVVTRPAVFLHGVTVAFWSGALLPLAGA